MWISGAAKKAGYFSISARIGRSSGSARGLSVLNLFGYTGGFSLYAAAGGARRTDTVDVARPAVLAARGNFERNGLSVAPEVAGFHAVDAFDFLEASRRATALGTMIS